MTHIHVPRRRATRWFPGAIWALAIAALFAFRLAFGLANEFYFEDETQVFLIGLRYYATGAWPYFGADVVWTMSQIPGALQGLLVGLPLKLAPVPEAPIVLVNLLTMGALSAFAWYVSARLPELPRWLVWGWLMTLPWTLHFSTHVINTSYILAPALIFFIGFFEAVPAFRLGRLPSWLAFFMMGAALVWVMQIHMSWPLLLPYLAVAWITSGRSDRGALPVNTAALLAGALLVGALLIPTFVTYGAAGGSGGVGRNIQWRPVGPSVAVSTLARFFSFASLEIARFLAPDGGKRVMLLARHPWLIPFVLIVWAAGVWQPLWMAWTWLRYRTPSPGWRPLQWLVAGTVALIYASYWFVIQPAQAHAFYVLAPVAFMFAAYCALSLDRRWLRIAGAALSANIVLHAGLAWIRIPEQSLYRNRDVFAAAIRLKEPEMFAFRRPFAIDGGPDALDPATRPYDALEDVRLTDEVRTDGPYGVVLWKVTLHNANPSVAFRDVRYLTTYTDAEGRVVDQRTDYVKEIFQPGATRRLEINDGIVRVPFASATISVSAANALLPAPQTIDHSN